MHYYTSRPLRVPFLLRQIRKSKWYKSEEVSWLHCGDLPADALGDIRTSSNGLSVWEIADDEANLAAVIAALAAGRDAAANFDFALLKQAAVLESNIPIHTKPGDTHDKQVNQFHRELTELSTVKLMALARIIHDEAKKERFPEPKILGLISNAIAEGRFAVEVLHKNIRNRLRK
jgi:hypothetical protein